MRRTSVSTSSSVADAEVGHAERARGHAAAREVDRPVAGALGQSAWIGADRAGNLQRLLGGQRARNSCRAMSGHHAPRPAACHGRSGGGVDTKNAAPAAGSAAPEACARWSIVPAVAIRRAVIELVRRAGSAPRRRPARRRAPPPRWRAPPRRAGTPTRSGSICEGWMLHMRRKPNSLRARLRRHAPRRDRRARASRRAPVPRSARARLRPSRTSHGAPADDRTGRG